MTTGKTITLDELFARKEAETRAELAAEDAAWKALPQAEKDRINAQRKADLEAFALACEAQEEDEGEEDEFDNEDGDYGWSEDD